MEVADEGGEPLWPEPRAPQGVEQLGTWTVSVQAVAAIVMGVLALNHLWLALPAAAAALVAVCVVGGERAWARRWGRARAWVVIIGAAIFAAVETGYLLWVAVVMGRTMWATDHGEAGLGLAGIVLPVALPVLVALAVAPLMALREATAAAVIEYQSAAELRRA